MSKTSTIRVNRPVFRRDVKYVATVSIPKHGLKAGDDWPITKTHITQMYYRNLQIGPKGHPWTEQAIAQSNEGRSVINPYVITDSIEIADEAKKPDGLLKRAVAKVNAKVRRSKNKKEAK